MGCYFSCDLNIKNSNASLTSTSQFSILLPTTKVYLSVNIVNCKKDLIHLQICIFKFVVVFHMTKIKSQI